MTHEVQTYAIQRSIAVTSVKQPHANSTCWNPSWSLPVQLPWPLETLEDTELRFYGVTNSWTWLSVWCTHIYTHIHTSHSSCRTAPSIYCQLNRARLFLLFSRLLQSLTFFFSEFLLQLIYNVMFTYSFLIFGHTLQHVASQFPDQGSNPHPLHWKVES